MTENPDWTFEQLSSLEKIDALVTEAIEQLGGQSAEREFPDLTRARVLLPFWLRSVKKFIDADLATVPASMRPGKCSECGGKGVIVETAHSPSGIMHSEFPCLACNDAERSEPRA